MWMPSSKGRTSSIFYTGNSSRLSLTLPPSLLWSGDRLELLDQRRLPQEVSFLTLRQWRDVAEAIATMAVVLGYRPIQAAWEAWFGEVLPWPQ